MGAYIRKAEEGELGQLLVETVILHSARTQPETAKALKDAAQHYKVDTDAIATESQSGVCREREGASRQEDGREGPAKTSHAANTSKEGQSRVTHNFRFFQTGPATAGSVSFRPSSRPVMCCRFAPGLIWGE